MREEHLAEGKGEKLLKTLDRRDKLTRVLELVVILIVLVINMYGLYQIQNIIKTNQAGTVEARKQNMVRQEEIKGYIKCIVLLKFDNPNLSPNSPREDVEAALDKCAVNK